MTLANIKAHAAQAAAQAASTPDTPDVPTTAAEVAVVTDDVTDDEPKILDRIAQDSWYRWVREHAGYWRQLLPAHISPETFELAALTAIQNSKQLINIAQNNPHSVVYALAMCAHFGLMPDGVQAAVIPFGNSAGFVPMYRGYITLLLRHKVITSIRLKLIREGDTVELDNGKPAPDDFSHKVNLLAPIPEGQKERTPLIAYVFGWHPDGSRTEVVTMTRQEAEFIRDEYSRAYQMAESNRVKRATDFAREPKNKDFNCPWHRAPGDTSGELAESMWLKSVVRQWIKRLDITPPAIGELIASDAADATTGQKVIVPAKVMRVLTADPQVVTSEPHRYVHDERTDPFCGLDGCEAYWDNVIHNVD